jgi:methylglutaconyl-CoA hydratase
VAARLGLFIAAGPADRLDHEIDAIVDDLRAGGPGAIAAAKRLIAEVPEMSVDDAFAWAAALSSELFAGAEAAEGMTAFLEKRPPRWVEGS